jgi:hypothetical protein
MNNRVELKSEPKLDLRRAFGSCDKRLNHIHTSFIDS